MIPFSIDCLCPGRSGRNDKNMFEKWITNQTAKPFYARKEIELVKPVKKALAKVCGLGQFNEGRLFL